MANTTLAEIEALKFGAKRWKCAFQVNSYSCLITSHGISCDPWVGAQIDNSHLCWGLITLSVMAAVVPNFRCRTFLTVKIVLHHCQSQQR